MDFTQSSVFIMKVIIATCSSAGAGLVIVDRLRILCHRTNDVWKLASVCYLLPLAVFIILNLAVLYNLCDKIISDSISFGVCLGICIKLLSKPNDEHTVRILVRTNNRSKEPLVVWLKSAETTVKDAICAFGDALSVKTYSRISVETGRGLFVTSVDEPLLSQISGGGHPGHTLLRFPSKDFFGFTTAVCNVVVRPEEIIDESDDDEQEEKDERTARPLTKRPANLTNIINSRGPVRWKDDLLLSASVGNVGQDFSVSHVAHYAAAAPPPQGYTYLTWKKNSPVRFVPWSLSEDDDHSDVHSEISLTTQNTRTSSWGFFKPKQTHSSILNSPSPVHDGDCIVIASHDGKFMSIRRGWWMAWNEGEPRRSGAFVVEIVERAPQIFTDLKNSLPNSPFSYPKLNQQTLARQGGDPKADSALRTGDSFRLRSVKYPDYELGITSKKIEGDHCYLGLHRANGLPENDENVWCHETRFSARYSNTLVF